MQYGRQQTRQVTGRQKRNGVIDIRGEVAILRIVRHAFAQQVTRLFQQRTGGQSFAHIQPRAAASHSTASTPRVFSAIAHRRRPAAGAIETWSSGLAEVGRLSTLCGCDSALFSLANAAAVTGQS